MQISSKKNAPHTIRLTLMLIAFALLLGAFVATACSNSNQEVDAVNSPPAAKGGRLAPNFLLSDLDGNEIDLSNLRGKTVIVNFWATWCPPCREEMPDIESLYQQYKNQGVEVIGIGMMENENRVREFVQKGNYSWTFTIDTKGDVARNYRVVAIPTSFFIDSQGIIRSIHRGPMNTGDIEDNVKKIIG